MLRDVECLETISRRCNNEEWIHKFHELIFNRLKYWLLSLTDAHVESVPRLPIAVLTVLVGLLFEKTVQFYREEYHPTSTQPGEHITKIEIYTKDASDYLLKILMKLLEECNGCTNQLVLESLSKSIKYLVLDNVDHKHLFSLCSDLIMVDCYPVEIIAYTMLNRWVYIL